MKTSLRQISAFLLVAVVVMQSTGLLFSAMGVPSATFTITSGMYPGTVTYTVWRESTTYYIKNANGFIEFSGTNLSYILENAIAIIPTGQGAEFYFARSNIVGVDSQFLLTNTIRINHNQIAFIGERGVYFDTTSDITMFNITGIYNRFEHLVFAQSAGSKIGTAIRVLNTTNDSMSIFLTDVRIVGFNYGLRLESLAMSTLKDVEITQCNYGLDLTGNSYLNVFIGVKISYCAGVGVNMNTTYDLGAYGNEFLLLDLEYNNIGVRMRYYSWENVFHNTWFEGQTGLDIDFDDDTGTDYVSMNRFEYGILDTLSINFGSGASNNTIVSDRTRSNTVTSLTDNGENNRIFTFDQIYNGSVTGWIPRNLGYAP